MSNFKNEKTLVLIKPDGIQRSLIGEIISRFEKIGLKIIGLKLFIPSKKQVLRQYAPDKKTVELLGEKAVKNQKINQKTKIDYYNEGLKIINYLIKYLTCGPLVAMVLQGNQAVEIVKKLVGTTEPLSSDVGTIRGDYTLDSYTIANYNGRAVRNLIHCSGSPNEAKREIKIWFKKKELCRYNLIQEKILYDVNLDGIRE